MDNVKKIPLIREDLLFELNSAIKSVGSDKNKSKVFVAENVENYPRSSPFTSLARLLSVEEVCGCIYQKENNEIFFSSNRNCINNRNTGSSFRKEIGDLLFNSFLNKLKSKDGKFSDEDKVLIYRKFFPIIKKKISRKKDRFVNTKISERWSNEVRTIVEEVCLKKDWDDQPIEKIDSVRKLIKRIVSFSSKYTDEEEIPKKIFIFSTFADSLTYLESIEDIWNFNNNEISLLIKNKNYKDPFFNRIESSDGLHCELAMIEKEWNEKFKILRSDKETELAFINLVKDINDRVNLGRFTISKFCCLICYFVFRSLSETHNHLKSRNSLPGIKDKTSNSIDFEFLGNSRIFFPNCSTFHLIENNEFHQVRNRIDRYISKLKESLLEESLEDKVQKISLVDSEETFIENTEVINYKSW